MHVFLFESPLDLRMQILATIVHFSTWISFRLSARRTERAEAISRETSLDRVDSGSTNDGSDKVHEYASAGRLHWGQEQTDTVSSRQVSICFHAHIHTHTHTHTHTHEDAFVPTCRCWLGGAWRSLLGLTCFCAEPRTCSIWLL